MILQPEHRFRSEQEGIVSLHCFSAGAHYDPDNVAFGPVVGLDEHLVAPGAGFDWHGHRGVHIVSWVLEGVLRHEDSNGAERFVPPGALLVQSTGDGIRHRETNASEVDPLRFVQLAIIGSGEPRVELTRPPVTVGSCAVLVHNGRIELDGFAFVTRGRFSVAGAELGEGASVRAAEPTVVDGSGELLVVTTAR